jgi:hypothetical protein
MPVPGTALAGHVSHAELLMFSLQWLSLWLGFSLLSRRHSAASTLAACAFICLSTYFLSSAYLLAPERVPGSELWGAWVGNLVPFAPALLLHACLCLTGARRPRQRVLLALTYGLAAAVFLAGFSNRLLYHYLAPGSAAAKSANGALVIGPLYPLQVVQITLTLVLALTVLWRAHWTHPRPTATVVGQLNLLCVGVALMLVGSALMFANVYLGGNLLDESLLDPILVGGGLLVAMGFAGYPGLLEGQLLRSDLKSSLLASCLVMTAFVGLVLAAGASFRVLAGLGWLVLAVTVFGDGLRAVTDRAFFGAGSRAGRAGLRTAAAYAGSERLLDLAALSPGHSTELVGYFSEVDRAGLAAARLDDVRDVRLELLARDEFANVRAALGLPASWRPADGLPAEQIRERLLVRLEPRERQALGLKYLGYSDKEMARFMDVRPNVPRSYLSEGKRKLGLAAGASLTLFVHCAGLLERDTLPLLPSRDTPAAVAPPAGAAGSPDAEHPPDIPQPEPDQGLDPQA